MDGQAEINRRSQDPAAAKLQSGSCHPEILHRRKVDILHQRAADFGFPVRHLEQAKDPEILKIVLAACALAS